MDDAKSLGLDGFSIGFFKENWEIVGKEVSEVVKELFKNSNLLK